jgi:hypothetical protein
MERQPGRGFDPAVVTDDSKLFTCVRINIFKSAGRRALFSSANFDAQCGL